MVSHGRLGDPGAARLYAPGREEPRSHCPAGAASRRTRLGSQQGLGQVDRRDPSPGRCTASAATDTGWRSAGTDRPNHVLLGARTQGVGPKRTRITTQTSPRNHRWTGRPHRSPGNGAPSGEGAGRVNRDLKLRLMATARRRQIASTHKTNSLVRQGRQLRLEWSESRSPHVTTGASGSGRVPRHSDAATSSDRRRTRANPRKNEAQGSIGRHAYGNVRVTLRT